MSTFNIIEDYYQIFLRPSLPLSNIYLWARLVTALVICFLKANGIVRPQEKLSAFLLFFPARELS